MNSNDQINVAPRPFQGGPGLVQNNQMDQVRQVEPASQQNVNLFSFFDRRKYQVKPKIVLYGNPGVGKTTIASLFPNPIFLSTNGEIFRLPEHVKHVAYIKDMASLLNALSRLLLDCFLAKQQNLYSPKTLVIDNLGEIEKILQMQAALIHSKKVCSEVGFQRGLITAAELWDQREEVLIPKQLIGPIFNKNKCTILESLDTLRSHFGMLIILIGHADEKKSNSREDAIITDLQTTKYFKPLIMNAFDEAYYIHNVSKEDISEYSSKYGVNIPQNAERVLFLKHPKKEIWTKTKLGIDYVVLDKNKNVLNDLLSKLNSY